jgi:hypothetical protein
MTDHISPATDTIEGGLLLLLEAVKAGDPRDEIIWRIQEELRQVRLRCSAQQHDGPNPLRVAMARAIDLLTERTYGSPARSPGHNARLVLEAALAAPVASTNRPELNLMALRDIIAQHQKCFLPCACTRNPQPSDCASLAEKIINAMSSTDSTGCICQEQHRRGYCTEPGCSFASTNEDTTKTVIFEPDFDYGQERKHWGDDWS